MNWTPAALDRLERAMAEGGRVRLRVRGAEIMLLPDEMRYDYGGERIVGRNLGSGDRVEVPLDEVEAFTVID